MEPTTPQQQVVEACRALAAYGLGPGIGGHVSLRAPGRRAYWANTLDGCLEEVTEKDLVLLDFEGTQLEGRGEPSPAIDFHAGIYALREDVAAIVHTHGFWITAQAAFGRPPRSWQNVCSLFHERTAVSPDDSVESIPRALGDKVAIVIPWHGAITVGSSLGDAAALHLAFDYACHLDVVMAHTGAEPMPDARSMETQAHMLAGGYLDKTWEMMQRKAARAWSQDGGVHA